LNSTRVKSDQETLMEDYRARVRLEFAAASSADWNARDATRDKSREATARALPRKREYAERADTRQVIRKAA